MEPKRPKGKKTMQAVEEKLRAVRLELSGEEHARLRVAAAKLDTSLMHLARDLVAEGLARLETQKPPRRGKGQEGE
jgi:hypothetical protein